jgi:hypothetical protein
MITLQVEDYCQNCLHFEARTDAISSLVSANFIITCAYAEKCRALLKHLEENKDKKSSWAPLN